MLFTIVLFVCLEALCLGEILDLSHPLNKDTPYFMVGQNAFSLEILIDGPFIDGWFQNDNIATGLHVGTHMDAPSHMNRDSWNVDEIPIERLVGPAVVIDIRQQAAMSRDTNLTADIIKDWENTHGRIPPGAIVFQCSGWTAKYSNHLDYFGGFPNDTTTYHFPGFSFDAAKFLIDERGIVGFGVDTPSMDYGQSPNIPVHFYFAAKNVYGLENVNDPCRVPAKGATVVVSPIKVTGGSGGPVRITAMWDVEPTNKPMDKPANHGNSLQPMIVVHVFILLSALSMSNSGLEFFDV